MLASCLSSSTTTNTTTTSHRIGWPCVGGRVRGKPGVSRDFSLRAKPVFAVGTTSASRYYDDDALQDSSTTFSSFSYSYSFYSSSSTTTTTTTTTTPSHRVGWPCVEGRIRGKPRVSRDCSFRANPAFAVTSILASREDDDDILEESIINTNIATTKTIK